MEGTEMPRPMTHDLIITMLKGFQTNLKCVQVYKLEGGTFYAYLILSQEGDTTADTSIIKIDCRPSDAIAIAVRMSSPVYVAEEVLRVAGQDGMPSDDIDNDEGIDGEEDFLE